MRIGVWLLALWMTGLLTGCKSDKKGDEDKDIANLPKEEQLMEYNRQTMQTLPMPMDEGVVMQRVAVEDSMEVYYYSIDQKHVNRSLVEQNVGRFQEHPEDLLDMTDANVKTMIALLYELRMGLEYRYVFSDDKDTVSIIYPRKTLRNLYAVELLRQAGEEE